LLSHLVQSHNWEQVLVFTRTKHIANRLAERLERDGVSAAAIHGNKSQGARTKALAGFKDGSVRVLVATDIAARGLDIDKLPQVVNFELPNVAEDYVHRIGRTGRAGAAGHAISLVSADEGKLLRGIERLTKQELPREIVAGFEPDAVTLRAIEQGTGQPARKGQGSDEPRNSRSGSGRPGQGRRPQQGGQSRSADGNSRPAGNGARTGRPNHDGARSAGAEGNRRQPQRAPDRHANQAVKPHGNK
jgi:ATP-dependent RNA helicase RhlE